MRIEFAIPEHTENLVEVRRGDVVADSFEAVWLTPDDNQSLEIQEARITVIEFFQQKSTAASLDEFKSIIEKLKGVRQHVDTLIRHHLVTINDPAYEPSDLDRMLRHDMYRGALLVSLYGVTVGELRQKNSVPPGASGQPDDAPAEEVSKRLP